MFPRCEVSVTSWSGFPETEPSASILSSTSSPSTTRPKTTCLLSSLSDDQSTLRVQGEATRSHQGDGAKVMKNWLVLEFGPVFAIESVPETRRKHITALSQTATTNLVTPTSAIMLQNEILIAKRPSSNRTFPSCWRFSEEQA